MNFSKIFQQQQQQWKNEGGQEYVNDRPNDQPSEKKAHLYINSSGVGTFWTNSQSVRGQPPHDRQMDRHGSSLLNNS